MEKVQLEMIKLAIMAGSATYEQATDLFMSSIVGQRAGVTKEQFANRLREKFPTEAQLSEFLRQRLSQFYESPSTAPFN